MTERNETPNPDTNPDIVTGYSPESDGTAVSGHPRNETQTEQTWLEKRIAEKEADPVKRAGLLKARLEIAHGEIRARDEEIDRLTSTVATLQTRVAADDDLMDEILAELRKAGVAPDGDVYAPDAIATLTAERDEKAAAIDAVYAKAVALQNDIAEFIAAKDAQIATLTEQLREARAERDEARDHNDYLTPRYQDAMDMLATLRTPSPDLEGWISVRDRLPEPYAIVLVFGVAYDNPHCDDVSMYIDVVYRAGDKWRLDPDVENEVNITHWRALPDPPKGDE